MGAFSVLRRSSHDYSIHNDIDLLCVINMEYTINKRYIHLCSNKMLTVLEIANMTSFCIDVEYVYSMAHRNIITKYNNCNFLSPNSYKLLKRTGA